MTAEALPASTLVLLKPADHGFTILLMQRPSRSSFMGGMHVFPGGKVEPSDSTPAATDTGRKLASRMRLPAGECEAYAHAACRETFEEMGLLLRMPAPDIDLREARQRLEDGLLSWPDWPPSSLAGISLVYFDHWITPKIEPKRFDTRFFVAALPGGVEPVPNRESVSWGFYTPTQALGMVERREMTLAPPTLVTMQRLARYTTVEEALAQLASREVAPLEPELLSSDPITLVLPGHPKHSQKHGVPDDPRAVEVIDGRFHIFWE